MKQELHALFVDDDQVIRDQYFENLSIALYDCSGITLTHEAVDRIESAKSALPTGQKRFKLVVVDVLWRPLGRKKGEREPLGFQVIDQAIKTDGVVIVAVSVGNLEHFPFLERDALKRGAHLFRYRSALQSASEIGGWEELAREIAGKLRQLATAGEEDLQPPLLAQSARPAFVVCGRDNRRNEAVFQFVRAIGLEALEWRHLEEQAVREGEGGNPHIFDIIRLGFARAHGAIVIFSPDDEARLREPADPLASEDDFRARFQPRPNVLLEAGYALSHARERTLIVTIGKVELPTDLDGMHILHLDNTTSKRKAFAQRLAGMGFPVNTVGDHWLRIGDFS